jgi:hypothetical protein
VAQRCSNSPPLPISPRARVQAVRREVDGKLVIQSHRHAHANPTPDKRHVYILHCDEEFTRSEEVRKLVVQVLADGMGDLNITRLDGRSWGWMS